MIDNDIDKVHYHRTSMQQCENDWRCSITTWW